MHSSDHFDFAESCIRDRHQRLARSGCEIVKDEPEFPRCDAKDPFGPIYKLTRGRLTEP